MVETFILSENVLFCVFIKTTFLGKTLSKYLFLHYSARFFNYFWLFFKVRLNDVEIKFFCLTAIFSLLCSLRFDFFGVFKIP